MADGYGYAAEGDATAAMLMAAMLRLCGQAGFSEMYMMDFAREAILYATRARATGPCAAGTKSLS